MRIKTLVILVLFFLCLPVFAQKTANSNRPKIGLVLSGGGAKGFAHVGVIKALEEAGIKPDYITGTSMGSIIGALYAIGYTPEQIVEISNTVNWTDAMSNSVKLNEIAQEEKPYYQRFITELSVEDKKVSLPGGLIEGQNLQDLLTILTRNVHYQTDFLKFPIPYSCVATNIETGKPVVLNKGSLVNSIRASMAIPSIFTPVMIDSTLLIDGGWVRNLPVQEALEMGANIIIAVDVGAPLKKKKDLKSLVSILDQTAWLLSTQDTERQRKLANYVVMPDISGIESFQFDRADTIIARGYKAAMKQFDTFKALAEKIYPNGHYDKEIIVPPFDTAYSFNKISVEGTKYTTPKYVRRKLGIRLGDTVSLQEIQNRIKNLYGSTYYTKVNFSLKSYPDGKHELAVFVIEDAPIKMKLGVYYDTESSVGLNLNITLRNIVFKNSRLIVDGYISEDFQFELNYLKYIDRKQKFYAFLNGKYVKDSRFKADNLNGEEAVYKYRMLNTDIGVAYNFTRNITLGIAGSYRYAWAIPDVNADGVVKQINQGDIPLSLSFILNTFNKPFYPTRGWRVTTDFGYLIHAEQRVKLTDDFKDIEDEANEFVRINPYGWLNLWAEKYFGLSPKVALYLSGGTYFTTKPEDLTGFNSSISIGGLAPLLPNSSQFWGAEKSAYSSNQFSKLSFGIQWEILANFYVRGFANYFNYNYPMTLINGELTKVFFEENGVTYDQNFGGGIELAYNSKIGPLRIALHQGLYSDLNIFVGVGFPFRKTRPYF